MSRLRHTPSHRSHKQGAARVHTVLLHVTPASVKVCQGCTDRLQIVRVVLTSLSASEQCVMCFDKSYNWQRLSARRDTYSHCIQPFNIYANQAHTNSSASSSVKLDDTTASRGKLHYPLQRGGQHVLLHSAALHLHCTGYTMGEGSCNNLLYNL
jgi:hypothetical protein